MAENVFVLGLDEHNETLLHDLPDAERYRFYPLLTIDELQHGEEIPLRALLEKAQTQLENFDGPVDAIIGFWDFPVSSMRSAGSSARRSASTTAHIPYPGRCGPGTKPAWSM